MPPGCGDDAFNLLDRQKRGSSASKVQCVRRQFMLCRDERYFVANSIDVRLNEIAHTCVSIEGTIGAQCSTKGYVDVDAKSPLIPDDHLSAC